MVQNHITLETVNDIEQRFPVDEWIIGELHIWPWIRIQLMRQPFDVSERVAPPSFRERLARTLLFRYDRARRFLHPRRRRVNEQKISANAEVIFQSFFNKRMYFENSWYDQHCDPIIEDLQKNGITPLLLEQAGSLTLDGRPRQHGEHTVSYDAPLFEFLEKNKARLADSASLEVSLPRYEEFRAYIKEKIPFHKESAFTETKIRSDIQRILLQKEFFVTVLKRNPRARLSLIVCYYHSPGMAFTLACKESGVLAVDLQHGCQHHTAYSKWLKVPNGGYEMIPPLFWNWDKEHADDINAWAEKTNGAHRAFVGGYPWLSLWQDENASLPQLYKKSVEPVFRNRGVRILMTLNGLPEPMPLWVLETIAQSPPHWFWYVRPHPLQRKKTRDIEAYFHSIAGGERCYVQTRMDVPLPALLSVADVHVTNTSSVVLEAEKFGIPSVSTDPDTQTTYPDQFKSGMMIYAGTPEDLQKAIVTQIAEKRKRGVKNKFLKASSPYSTIMNLLHTQV